MVKKLVLIIIISALLFSCSLEMSDPVAYVAFFLRERHKPAAYDTDLLSPKIPLAELREGNYYAIPKGAGTYYITCDYGGPTYAVSVKIEVNDRYKDHGNLRFGKENTFYDVYFQEDKAPVVYRFPATD